MASTFKARKRKKPINQPLPPGYGDMSGQTQQMRDNAMGGAIGTGIGGVIGGGLGALASAGSFGTLAPVLIPGGAMLGAAVGGMIGGAGAKEAEANFAAEQAARDAAFAMQQFEYQRARDEFEYDEAVFRQNQANAFARTPRLENMNQPIVYRRG